MEMRGAGNLWVRAAAILAVSAGSAQAVTTWHRSTDWVPGSTQGLPTNNPGPVAGTATWQYESVQGGGFGSLNPWYAQHGQLLTWDSNWYSTGWGVWSKGDNLNPPILAGRMIHNVAPSVYDNIPLVRWLNPIGNGAVVNIAGTLTVNWNGVNGVGRPDNVDVVIAKHIAATNSDVVLFSNTVSKPNPFPSVGDSRFLPVSLTGIALSAGDSIVISHRGQNSVGPLGAWINLYDDVTISTIPVPSGMSLLGAAGLIAIRRKRR